MNNIQASTKNQQFFEVPNDLQWDIIGAVEINTDWRLIPPNDGMYERSKASKEQCKAAVAHNETEPPKTKRQYGGVMMAGFKEAILRITDMSCDPELLG